MVFIESKVFTKRLKELAGEVWHEVFQALQEDLLDNPDRGRMVQGLGGVRKARVENPGRGKGKRGGYRYLYLYLSNRSHVHLLYLLDKNEQEDLAADDRKRLRALVAQLKAAGGLNG